MPRLMTEFKARNQAYKDNPVGLKNFLSAFPETMSATLALVREKYDGVESYCKKYMQLESEDLGKIRQNLLLGVHHPAKSGYGHHAM
ncbi:hypothetical protein SERLA73DRAFT_186890 [Serpula lacrymans var. lacrymans S7.3]|uniref:Uncharacterized protein n=2 Tax=Serpula lacrymans var. lacrymans TaxID=341189 RepID=F8Q822_SERL3|nr:hypothetical protein SERLA73DRAFT_186890 [Serpula lacrymans var. lacrymans S7.3]